MNVAIVGAGPAGSLLAYRLAGSGHRVSLYDASHPREKPCGGGITGKALALLPAAPAADPLPAHWVDACRFESGDGPAVDVRLARPVAVSSRRELDAWLLRRAVDAGACHLALRVQAVEADGRLRAGGKEKRFDLVVGADGAGSLVRRSLLYPTPPARRAMAAGWYAPGTSPMLVRFLPGLAGYLWLFPRRDHVGVGICAPLGQVPSRELLSRLRHEIDGSFPALAQGDRPAYAHTIPSPSAAPESIEEIAGERWALVGDAAALADPITGEGIYYALRSAVLLADTLARGGTPRAYAAAALGDFGRELLKSASLHTRFYTPGFARRMIAASARSAGIRDVLGDLVLGEQGYVGLKRRLLRTAPRFAWEWLRGA